MNRSSDIEPAVSRQVRPSLPDVARAAFPDRSPFPPAGNGQNWTIRPFRSGDGEQLNALFNRVFKKHRPLDVWSWKFERHPAPLPTIVTVAALNGQIVGMYPCVCTLWKVGEEVSPVVQPVETAIEERLRGGRLILALHQAHVDRCEEQGVRFAYGTPNEGHARLGRRRLGYIPLADLAVLQRAVNVKLPLIGYLRGPFKSAAMMAARARWRRSLRSLPQASGVSVAVRQEIDPRVDELWARVSPSHGVMTVRTGSYLTWRYFQRAGQDERLCFTATDERGLVGYLILALSQKRLQRIGIVADALSLPQADVLEILVRHAMAYCAEARVDYVIGGALPHMELYRALASCGFAPSARARPVVCEPFSRADPQIFIDTTKWYLTLGDFDFDED